MKFVGSIDGCAFWTRRFLEMTEIPLHLHTHTALPLHLICPDSPVVQGRQDDHSTAALVAAVIVAVVLVVALAVALVFLLLRNDVRKITKSLGTNLLTNKSMPEAEGGIAITPLDSAFLIPIDQLEVGPVIAVGGQGQVRKGFFSGKAVACKELLASVFDPKETEALLVRPFSNTITLR